MYCTESDVLGLIRGVDLAALGDAAAQSAAVADAITVAGCDVDARCRRTFEPPETPETRTFDGTGGLLLRVPDMVRVDAVALNGASVSPVYAYPQDGPPFRWIATGGRFAPGFQNVSVTGLWGYAAAVPEDVARATAFLAAAEILGRLQAERSGGVALQVTGLAREEFPPDGPYGDRINALSGEAARLLLPYRRWLI